MRAAPPAYAIALAACLYFSHAAPAQDSAQPVQGQASAIPDAPTPSASPVGGAPQPPGQVSPSKHLVPETSAIQPGTPLTLHDRFVLEARTTFGPPSFILPALDAAVIMANPPHGYPRAWSDGGDAFGRNYGAEFAENTTAGFAHFTTAIVLREDPRYYPSTSTNLAGRALHALLFTFVDRSDSGRRTLAVSNLAGATAGGFVGMSYEPPGFNDATHAWQRASVELTDFASHNFTAEFSPELAHLAHKLHFPDRIADSFLPPDRKQPKP